MPRIALAVIALVVAWYFVSDPFEARVNRAFEDATEWTNEAILEDPDLYLDQCERDLNAAKKEVESKKANVRKTLRDLEKQKSENESKAALAAEALDKAKLAFVGATQSSSWPATVQYRGGSRTYTEPELKQQIISWNRECQATRQILSALEQGVARLKNAEMQLSENKSNIELELAQLGAKRELIKVTSATKDLESQLEGLRDVVGGLVDFAEESDDLMTVDDLVEATPLINEEEFDSIMGFGDAQPESEPAPADAAGGGN